MALPRMFAAARSSRADASIGPYMGLWCVGFALCRLAASPRCPITGVSLKNLQHCLILLKAASAALRNLGIHQVFLRFRALHPLLFSEPFFSFGHFWFIRFDFEISWQRGPKMDGSINRNRIVSVPQKHISQYSL